MTKESKIQSTLSLVYLLTGRYTAGRLTRVKHHSVPKEEIIGSREVRLSEFRLISIWRGSSMDIKLEFVRIAVVFRTHLKHHAHSHVCTRTWTASKKWYRAPTLAGYKEIFVINIQLPL
jgi:hypothetical protein